MRRSHHPNSEGAPRWATRFAALLAVFLQAFVIQAHVHAFSPLAGPGYQSSVGETSHAAVETPATHEAAIACAMCQAQASRVLASTAAASVPANNPSYSEPAVAIRRVSVAAAYSWQSRAPPARI